MRLKINLFNNIEVIKKENIEEFNQEGVWALFGCRKDIDDSKIYCLQVGTTNNIKKGVFKNIQLIEEEFEEFISYSPYINQFGEKLFDYKIFSTYREQLYSKEIKEKFYNYIFIVVSKVANFDIEKEFAFRTKSIYWRHGRPFKSGKMFCFNNRVESYLYTESKSKLSIDLLKFIEKYNNQQDLYF